MPVRGQGKRVRTYRAERRSRISRSTRAIRSRLPRFTPSWHAPPHFFDSLGRQLELAWCVLGVQRTAAASSPLSRLVRRQGQCARKDEPTVKGRPRRCRDQTLCRQFFSELCRAATIATAEEYSAIILGTRVYGSFWVRCVRINVIPPVDWPALRGAYVSLQAARWDPLRRGSQGSRRDHCLQRSGGCW